MPTVLSSHTFYRTDPWGPGLQEFSSTSSGGRERFPIYFILDDNEVNGGDMITCTLLCVCVEVLADVILDFGAL